MKIMRKFISLLLIVLLLLVIFIAAKLTFLKPNVLTNSNKLDKIQTTKYIEDLKSKNKIDPQVLTNQIHETKLELVHKRRLNYKETIIDNGIMKVRLTRKQLDVDLNFNIEVVYPIDFIEVQEVLDDGTIILFMPRGGYMTKHPVLLNDSKLTATKGFLTRNYKPEETYEVIKIATVYCHNYINDTIRQNLKFSEADEMGSKDLMQREFQEVVRGALDKLGYDKVKFATTIYKDLDGNEY